MKKIIEFSIITEGLSARQIVHRFCKENGICIDCFRAMAEGLNTRCARCAEKNKKSVGVWRKKQREKIQKTREMVSRGLTSKLSGSTPIKPLDT